MDLLHGFEVLSTTEETFFFCFVFFIVFLLLFLFFYVVDHFIANSVGYPVLACYQLEIAAKQSCF